MLQQVLRWIVSKLVEFLDPTYKADYDAYYAKRKEQEAAILLLKAEIASGEQRIRDIQVERESVKAELELSALRLDGLEQQRNEALRKEQNALKDIAHKSDSDLLRDDL